MTRLDQKQPELLDVSDDMPDIAAASALNLNELMSELRQLESGAASVQQELTAIGKEVAAAHRAPLSAQDLERIDARATDTGAKAMDKENNALADVRDKQGLAVNTPANLSGKQTAWGPGLDVALAKSCRDKLAAFGVEVSAAVDKQRSSVTEMQSEFSGLLTLYGEEPNCSFRYFIEIRRFYTV